MSFPSGSVTRDMAIFLEMAALESAVLKLRPQSAGCLHKPNAGRPLLAFDLDDHQRVVVALVRGNAPGYSAEWVIEDARPGDHAARWTRRTRTEVLAQAVVDRIDAITTDPDDG